MTVKLDISAMDTTTKTALGNAFAYGLHASMCDGVSGLWETLGDCFMGKGISVGGDAVKFGMKLDIDSQLVSATPTCTGLTGTDCYGGKVATRRLAETSITNKAAFEVAASGKAFAKVAEAKTSLTAAETTAFKPEAIAKHVKKAVERPSMPNTLTALVANITAAVKAATVNVTAPDYAGDAPAPPAATSGAFATGVAGVFAVVAGAALF